jgi:hypothetical protein
MSSLLGAVGHHFVGPIEETLLCGMRPLAGAGREELRRPFSIQPEFAVNLAVRDCIGDGSSVSMSFKDLPRLDEQGQISVSGPEYSIGIWSLTSDGVFWGLETKRKWRP